MPNKKKHQEPYEGIKALNFLREHKDDVVRYVGDTPTVIYGMGGTSGELFSQWIASVLRSWGRRIWHVDLKFYDSSMSGFDEEYVKGHKVLSIREGPLNPNDLEFAKTMKKLKATHIIRDYKHIITVPEFRMYTLEQMLM